MTNETKQRVLCAIDYSPMADAALDQAIAIAADRGASLDVVHVASTMDPTMIPSVGLVMPPMPFDREGEIQRLRQHVEACANDNTKKNGSAAVDRITVYLRLGGAAEEITTLAADLESDLIVLATHGRTGLRRAVLGSVAEKVVRTAPCPVFVVRPKLVPVHIEPPCPQCVERRRATGGAEVWCARHSEHHVRPHVLTYVNDRFESADLGHYTGQQ